MSKASRQGRVRVSRRRFLGGAAVAMAGAIAMPAIVRGQAQTVRFWSTQTGSSQVKAYRAIIERFEKAHPGIKVQMEGAQAEPLWEKLIAGFAARQVPDLVSHLPAPPIVQLNEEGLVEPFDDIINAVGKDDFLPGAIDLYRDGKRGYYMAATVVNQCTNSFWYRKDMLAEAGVTPPNTWDELVAFAKAATKGGVYGTCFPAGKNDMGSVMMIATLWQAGGTIVDPGLNVTFNSPQCVAALEFMKEIFPYSPAGSAGYSYTEAINTFTTARVGSTAYTGRVLSQVVAQNPQIADKISVKAYPHLRNGGAQGNRASFTNLFIPKGGRNIEGAKLFARWLYNSENYVEFLHSAPGHNLPVLKSIAASKAFTDHPLLVRYKDELATLIDNMTTSRNELRESPKHQFNRKAGELFSTKLLAEIMQDVLVGNMSPKEAAAKGADRIARVMKG